MTEYICLLITFFYKRDLTLERCVLKVKMDRLKGDCRKCPMEPENRQQLYDLLPEHIQTLGDIVEVSEIYDIVYIEK